MTTITRERLLKIQQWRETYGAGSNVILPAEEAEELARIALASLEAKPVAWECGENIILFNPDTVEAYAKRAEISPKPLYAAPPVSERDRIRREHAEWSDKTFGNVGPVGPLKHLSKEALEAAAAPSDPLEWADMQFLLWDAQRRMGISDEFITRAMIEKLEINKSRQWPEPKDGEPRLHIKEQPVLVATGATYSGFEDFWSACKHPFAQDDELKDVSWVIWNACRTAILRPEPQNALQNIPENIPAGKSTLTPDGWISCSERMPEDEQEVIVQNKLGYRYVSYFDEHSGLFFDMPGGNQMNCIEHILVTHWMPLPEPPQQE